MAEWIEDWYGFDLDGTIADDQTEGYEIGSPIQKMIERIKQLRQEGKEVKIVTTRVDGNVRAKNKEDALAKEKFADVPLIIAEIERWCLYHIGEVLPITDRKDCGMRLLFDDKAIRVNKNTGELCTGCRHHLENGVEHSTVKQIGNFYDMEEIGGGQISAVYKAIEVDEFEGKLIVAVKCLRDKWIDNQTVLDQFNIECKIAENFSIVHSNIVSMEYCVRVNGKDYIVMEYLVDTINLEDEIKKGKKFSIKETKTILHPIADALDYLHLSRIYHCDVKPRNILLEFGKVPKLTDFGIAQLKDSETYFDISKIWGTVKNYIAPEVARGERATAKSDQYMLAVTAYEMMTGKVWHADYLTKALNKNPNDRFETCVDFINSLK